MNPIKIGMIGAGSRGIDGYGALLQKRGDVRIAAICDPNPVRAQVAAEQFSSDGQYESVPEMIAGEQLDAVTITSPDACHADNAVHALRHGIHALIDKPLATTVADCRRIIDTAKTSDAIAMIGFNLRHVATLRKLKEVVDSGELGRPFLIENREFYGGGRTYMSRWNRRYEESGGLWIHKGSHDFDVFNWLLGFPSPLRVASVAGVNALREDRIPFELEPDTPIGPTCGECAYAGTCPDVYEIGDNPLWDGRARQSDGYAKDTCMYTSDKNVHDNGIALVEYEDGSRASHMECFVTSQCDRLYTVVGDRGQAEASLESRRITVTPRWSDDARIYDVPEEEGGHDGSDPQLIDTFIRVARGELPNPSTLEHGLMATAIGQAAELSWREERMVKMSELLD